MYQGKFLDLQKMYHRYAYSILVKIKGENDYKNLFGVSDKNSKLKAKYESWVKRIKKSLMEKFKEIEDVILRHNDVYQHPLLYKKLASNSIITKNEQKYLLRKISQKYKSLEDILINKLDFKNPFHRGIIVFLMISNNCKINTKIVESVFEEI